MPRECSDVGGENLDKPDWITSLFSSKKKKAKKKKEAVVNQAIGWQTVRVDFLNETYHDAKFCFVILAEKAAVQADEPGKSSC